MNDDNEMIYSYKGSASADKNAVKGFKKKEPGKLYFKSD